VPSDMSYATDVSTTPVAMVMTRIPEAGSASSGFRLFRDRVGANRIQDRAVTDFEADLEPVPMVPTEAKRP